MVLIFGQDCRFGQVFLFGIDCLFGLDLFTQLLFLVLILVFGAHHILIVGNFTDYFSISEIK